jgi:hypothetical protein
MGENRNNGPPAVIAMSPTPSRMPAPSQKMPPSAKPAPDRSRAVQPRRPLNLRIDGAIKRANAGPMVAKIARAVSAIHPEAEGSEIKFTKEEVFLDSKKIGDIRIDQDMVKVRIWLQNLGYFSGSLGPDELGDVFEINRQQFEEVIKKSNYLVILGLQQGNLAHVGLCFYKDFETRMPPAFPLKE